MTIQENLQLEITTIDTVLPRNPDNVGYHRATDTLYPQKQDRPLLSFTEITQD